MIFWIGFTLLVIGGILVLIKRREVAWGISVSFGAGAHPGCAVAVAIALFICAAALVAFHRMGLL